MKRISALIVFALIFSFPCNAQNNTEDNDNIDNIYSLDFSYAFTSLFNHGWGLGLNYERRLYNFLSVKGNLGHMTFMTTLEDVYSTSVSVSLFFNYYPYSHGLDKFYLSIGGGCDFIHYFGSGDLPDTTEDTLIHITPQLGWKFHVLPFLMIDPSVRYKLVFYNTNNYSEVSHFVNPGLHFGLNFNLFLDKLFKKGK